MISARTTACHPEVAGSSPVAPVVDLQCGYDDADPQASANPSSATRAKVEMRESRERGRPSAGEERQLVAARERRLRDRLSQELRPAEHGSLIRLIRSGGERA
jgi:hypothetical protein